MITCTLIALALLGSGVMLLAGDFRRVKELDRVLLWAVDRLENSTHPVMIRDLVEQRTCRPISFGELYIGLDRLEKSGLLKSWRTRATPERGGRERKCYGLTDSGREFLEKHS